MEWWGNFCSVLGSHRTLKELDLGGSILSQWAMRILCLELGNQSCRIQRMT